MDDRLRPVKEGSGRLPPESASHDPEAVTKFSVGGLAVGPCSGHTHIPGHITAEPCTAGGSV